MVFGLPQLVPIVSIVPQTPIPYILFSILIPYYSMEIHLLLYLYFTTTL